MLFSESIQRWFQGRLGLIDSMCSSISSRKFSPTMSSHHVDTAQILIAEIGTDMSQFPTAGHLLSWAGLIPRLDESAGKRRSTRVRKGAPWLKPVLVQCAWAAARKKNSYFQAQFLRLKARCGPKKAAVAVAASILTTASDYLPVIGQRVGVTLTGVRTPHAGRRHLLPGSRRRPFRPP